MSLTLIIPFLNEKKNLIKFFKDIEKYKKISNLNIIFVDDGSVDGSYQLIKKKIKKNRKYLLIKNKENYGSHFSMLNSLKFVKTNFFLFYFIDQEILLKDIIKLFHLAKKKNKTLIITRKHKSEMNFTSRFFWHLLFYTHKIKFKNISTILIKKNHINNLKNIKIYNSSFLYLELLKNIKYQKKCLEVKIKSNPRVLGKSNWTIFKKIKLFLILFYFKLSSIKLFCFFLSLFFLYKENYFFILIFGLLECYFIYNDKKKFYYKVYD